MTQDPSARPAWWRQALALEAGNQLKAAEELIRASNPSLYCAGQIAELYRLRAARFQGIGDSIGMIEAAKEAVAWIYTQASWATSGGEGTALMREATEFHQQIAKAFGIDGPT